MLLHKLDAVLTDTVQAEEDVETMASPAGKTGAVIEGEDRHGGVTWVKSGNPCQGFLSLASATP